MGAPGITTRSEQDKDGTQGPAALEECCFLAYGVLRNAQAGLPGRSSYQQRIFCPPSLLRPDRHAPNQPVLCLQQVLIASSLAREQRHPRPRELDLEPRAPAPGGLAPQKSRAGTTTPPVEPCHPLLRRLQSSRGHWPTDTDPGRQCYSILQGQGARVRRVGGSTGAPGRCPQLGLCSPAPTDTAKHPGSPSHIRDTIRNTTQSSSTDRFAQPFFPSPRPSFPPPNLPPTKPQPREDNAIVAPRRLSRSDDSLYSRHLDSWPGPPLWFRILRLPEPPR